MISYAYKNLNNPASIVKKAKELFELKTIEEQNGIWLGNDKILINVEDNVTRIILYDISVNIKNFRQYIMRKNWHGR